jgi:hypothetical protein
MRWPDGYIAAAVIDSVLRRPEKWNTFFLTLEVEYMFSGFAEPTRSSAQTYGDNGAAEHGEARVPRQR